MKILPPELMQIVASPSTKPTGEGMYAGWMNATKISMNERFKNGQRTCLTEFLGSYFNLT
jgi:hypothetical protein